MRPNQVIQGFSQLGPENVQGWTLPNLSGQPAAMLDYLVGKKLISTSGGEEEDAFS